MTRAQLFTRMTRHLSSKVPAEFSAENKQWLVDAGNKALNTFTRFLPGVRVQEMQSARLAAAVMQTITATGGDTTIAFSPTWAEVASHLGRTCTVGGDSARYNQLRSATSLLNAYEGATGATSLQVFADAVLVNPSYEVAGEVLLADGGDTFPLTFGLPNGAVPGYWRRSFGANSPMAQASAHYFVAARPTNWWVENLNGITGGANPQMLLRLWPQPDKFYSLSYTLRLWPTALVADDISSNLELPLQPNEEADFLDLCFPSLFECPLFQGGSNTEMLSAKAARAEESMKADAQDRGHQQPSLCRTKPGY